jgi:hypothetical protein
MTRIIDAIDEAVRGARDANRRRHEERSSIKEASSQPQTDIARELKTLASAIRTDEGTP